MSLIPSLLNPLSNIKANYNATTTPTVNDDLLNGYSVGSQWINISTDEYYICLDNAQGLAVWRSVGVAGDSFKGTWNASTNTPTLADGTGTNGDFYIVSVAGTQNLGSGSIDFTVGDQIIYNGIIWQKIESGVSYIPENVANKATDFSTINDTLYPSVEAAKEQLDLKEPVISSGSSNQFWDGAKTFRQVLDSDLSLSDITTNNSSTIKHGFLPKLSNSSTQFLNGEGNWITPSGIANSYVSLSFTAQTSVIVTHNFGAYPVVQVTLDSGADKVVTVPYTITHTSINAFIVTFTTSSTGVIMATVGSPQLASYATVSDNYTLTGDDYFVECNQENKTITLPTAVGRQGQIFNIDNSSIGDIDITTTGGQTIHGNAIITIPSSAVLTVVSNGSNWRIN